jgi:hypothetical protein
LLFQTSYAIGLHEAKDRVDHIPNCHRITSKQNERASIDTGLLAVSSDKTPGSL